MANSTPNRGMIPLGSFVGLGNAGTGNSAPAPAAPRADAGDDDRKCTACGEVVDDPDAAYCPYCGTPIAPDDQDVDDDTDDEMHGNTPAAQARQRERARIGAILGHANAHGREGQAAHIALNTRMGRREAIAFLGTAPRQAAAQADTSLAARMDGLRGVKPGMDAPVQPGGQKAIADSWDKAAARTGTKPRG